MGRRGGSPREALTASRQQNITSRANRFLVLVAVIWGLEGALRKWVPGMDQMGAVARDALLVGVLALFYVLGAPRRENRVWPIVWIATAFLAVHGLLNVIIGNTTLHVTALGMRSYLVPLLVVAFALTYADSRALEPVRVALSLLVLVNVAIVIVQVRSAPSAGINLEISGIDAHFVNPGGVVRATGTFAAVSGLASFLPVGLALSLGGVLDSARFRAVHAAAALSCVVIAAVGGSRGALVGAAIVGAAAVAVLAARLTWHSWTGLLAITGAAVTAAYVVAQTLPQVIESFGARVENAANVESPSGRVGNGIFGFLATDFPVLGHGAGSHSSGGFALAGQDWQEEEKFRWVFELGIVGYALAIASLIAGLIGVVYLIGSLRRASATHLLTVAAVTTVVLYGGITQQPTTQGALGIMAVALWMTRPADPDADGASPPHQRRIATTPRRAGSTRSSFRVRHRA
ncbi:hypothetical protein [Demequina sediminis]|uniref:hypothetical protein n=1 Tax=Demequina sediminis TaxID=1930058 RepID=UPI002573A6E9|nr:hypothetical protein [Demequina sediminis]